MAKPPLLQMFQAPALPSPFSRLKACAMLPKCCGVNGSCSWSIGPIGIEPRKFRSSHGKIPNKKWRIFHCTAVWIAAGSAPELGTNHDQITGFFPMLDVQITIFPAYSPSTICPIQINDIQWYPMVETPPISYMKPINNIDTMPHPNNPNNPMGSELDLFCTVVFIFVHMFRLNVLSSRFPKTQKTR